MQPKQSNNAVQGNMFDKTNINFAKQVGGGYHISPIYLLNYIYMQISFSFLRNGTIKHISFFVFIGVVTGGEGGGGYRPQPPTHPPSTIFDFLPTLMVSKSSLKELKSE